MDIKSVLFSEIMEHEGIKAEQLPEKTQKRIKQYYDILNSKKIIYRKYNKKDGTSELTPKAKDELDNLNELIISHIAEYLNDKEEAEAKEAEEKRLKEQAEEEEERKRQAEENKNANKDGQQNQQENGNNENVDEQEDNEDEEEDDEEDDGPFSSWGL